MLEEVLQKIDQVENLLEWFSLETAVGGRSLELTEVKPHCGSSQSRCRTCSGTMRFQRLISLPGS
jgi:hypothetical protein